MQSPTGLITATDVSRLLGVSTATVYAYVSRALIGAVQDPADSRRSLYNLRDVQILIEKKRRGRSRTAIAASTVNWGDPILQSSITEVAGGLVRYRGVDAVALAASATLEETAALLWGYDKALTDCVFGAIDERRRRLPAAMPLAQRCLEHLAALASCGPWTPQAEAALPAAFQIVRSLAAAAGGSGKASAPRPAHELLSLAWTGALSSADAIRRCLVLCADHELNASTYAARVVASTRAPLGACTLAGLAALSGPLHGGTSDRIRSMFANPALLAKPDAAIAARLAAGDSVPGFGHPLYPDGDPRATAILAVVGIPTAWRNVVKAVDCLSGLRPHIDFALLAVEHRFSLPQGAAFGMFATGRVVGWIAHSLEQWTDGRVIRPRATYVGGLDQADRR